MKQEQRLLQGKGTVEQHKKFMMMCTQLAEAFTRPIIGHPGWAASITSAQKLRIHVERLKQVKEMNGEKITMATDYEAMIYISTVSLSAPLDRMWLRIFFYLFKKFYPKRSDFIPDYEAKLNPHMDMGELNRLKRWLYKSRK